MTFRTPLLCIALLLLAPVACKRADPQATAAERSAAAEQAAQADLAAFDDAVAKENWPLAKAQADVLLMNHPGTQAARRVRAQFDAIKAKADAMRDATRLANLWTYQTQDVAGGQQVSASIYARDEVDVDGSGPKPVRLIFRDHPDWGRSSYLVLQGGDFRCPGGCRVQVTADDAAAKAMAATRPDTDEAIAMFIEDERALWRMAKDAKTIAIEFPTRDLGNKTAVFEVGGLDPARLPGWK